MSTDAHPDDIFSPRVRRVLTVTLFVSAVAVVTTLLYGAKFVSPQPGPTDSYGTGPLGHRAFAETMEHLGLHVLQSRGDRYDAGSAPLLFIEPANEARVEGRLRRLRDAIASRRDAHLPTIVVLPKWTFGVGLVPDGAASRVGPNALKPVVAAALPHERATVELRDDTEGHFRLEGPLGSFAAETPGLQVVTTPPTGATVLLETEFGAVVLRDPNGTVVVTDPDLLHSYNFHRADHAALWMALLEQLEADTLVIDETFHGHGKVLSLREALGQFPPILLVVHGLLLLLLLFWMGGRRFGPPLPDATRGYGPQEAIAVAASVLADGQPVGRLAYHYVLELLEDLRRRLGIGGTPSLEALAKRLDRIARERRVPPDWSRLLRRAHELRDRTRGAHPEAWKVVLSAHQLRQRLLQQPGLVAGVSPITITAPGPQDLQRNP